MSRPAGRTCVPGVWWNASGELAAALQALDPHDDDQRRQITAGLQALLVDSGQVPGQPAETLDAVSAR
jgi:hypothetical protein